MNLAGGNEFFSKHRKEGEGGRLRIAFVALATPLRRSSWSGMPWYSYQEVCRRFHDVHLIDTPRIDAVVERFSSLQRYGMSVRQQRLLSGYHGRLITREARRIAPDILLSVGASHKLLAADPGCPIIHISDGLFSTIAGYYEKYGRFQAATRRNAHADHQRLLDKTNLTLFASEWARSSAVKLYKYPEEQTRVVPFGANMDRDPRFRRRRDDGPLELLFVGYDWKRKGGATVLATWAELRRRTGDARLHIVGCEPAEASGLDGVTVYGRLDKSIASEMQQIDRLFRQASMFFMPSLQEAFGMVFCEAAAYGLPAVATDTGGVSTPVADGVTGLLLPPGSEPRVFADQILALWQDKQRYQGFSQAARTRYVRQLNWRAWGQGVADAINVVLGTSDTATHADFP